MAEFKDILEARYMTFSSPPTTNDALQLTSSVLDLIQSIEQRKRKRKANDEKAFREAIGLILGDLLLGKKVKKRHSPLVEQLDLDLPMHSSS